MIFGRKVKDKSIEESAEQVHKESIAQQPTHENIPDLMKDAIDCQFVKDQTEWEALEDYQREAIRAELHPTELEQAEMRLNNALGEQHWLRYHDFTASDEEHATAQRYVEEMEELVSEKKQQEFEEYEANEWESFNQKFDQKEIDIAHDENLSWQGKEEAMKELEIERAQAETELADRLSFEKNGGEVDHSFHEGEILDGEVVEW